MSTSILIGNVRYEDPSFYVRHAMQAVDESGLAAEAISTEKLVQSVKLPYDRNRGLPDLDVAELRLLRTRIDCLKREADVIYRPVENEVIVKDTMAVLDEDFGPFRKDAPFLIRETNFATLYFFNDRFLFQDNRLTELRADIPVPALFFSAGIMADLILNFAKAAASAAGNKAAMELIYILFPDSKPLDMKELLDSIRGLVRDENVRQTVETEAGHIQGLMADFTTYYKTRSESSAPKTELYAYLVGKHSELSRVLGVLRQEEYRATGLSPLLLGVTTLFLVEREMCLKDYSVEKPENSSNVKLITESAAIYVKHARETFKENLKRRLGKITEVEQEIQTIPIPTTGGVVYRKFYKYLDTFDSGKSFYFRVEVKEEEKVLSEAKSSRAEYVNMIEEGFDWILKTIDSWESIGKNPLPPAVGG